MRSQRLTLALCVVIPVSLAQIADSDGDGVRDSADNCIEVANGPLDPDAGGNVQLDTDQDGYGNACDCDLNNDGICDFLDLGRLKAVFFTSDPHGDINGDGTVDFLDLGRMKSQFFGAPGPSGRLTLTFRSR